MIICYDKHSNELKNVIQGFNPIPPYGEDISHINIPDQYLFIKRGDKIVINEKTNTIQIGTNIIQLNEELYTVITKDNCDDPILLEKL